MEKAKRALWAERLCEGSMILYLVWLTLPTLQTLGRSYFGVFAVGLFAVGALMDTDWLKKDWLTLLVRALCAALLALILRAFLKRGSADGGLAFLVQNGMFWFPLIWSAVMITRGHTEHITIILRMYMICMIATTVLTLIGNIPAATYELTTYSRLLGLGDTPPEVGRSIMLRGIGSYDFAYALVLTIPMICWFVSASKGWKRWLAVGFIALALVTLVKCMFLYAILFAGLILVVELLGALFRLIARKAFKKALSAGWSMLLTIPVFLLVFLLREPILRLGVSIADQLHLSVVSLNLTSVLQFVTGTIDQATNESRLWYYQDALRGFLSSPLLGGLTKDVTLSQHSETLDLLAGVGLIGTAVTALLCYALGRGNLTNVRKSPCFPHVALTLIVLAGICTLGTVTYSRDISLYIALLCCYLSVGAPRQTAQK